MVIRPIPSCPGYFATDAGEIVRNDRTLVSRDNGHGYRQISISINGKRGDRYIHRLVCEAFHGAPGEGEQARHLNGKRDDNRPDNLQWSDRATNEADKELHGTIVHGEASSNSRLTKAMVIAARDRARAGERYDHIAQSLGLPERLIADAISGRRWKRTPGALGACFSRRRFTDDDIRAIRALKGIETEQVIAARYGVWRGSIWQILNHQTYKNVQP